jgi:hypothetical protein
MHEKMLMLLVFLYIMASFRQKKVILRLTRRLIIIGSSFLVLCQWPVVHWVVPYAYHLRAVACVTGHVRFTALHFRLRQAPLLHKGGLKLWAHGSVKVACMAMECGSEAAALVAGSALPANAAPPGAPKREQAPALHGASRAERPRNPVSLDFDVTLATDTNMPYQNETVATNGTDGTIYFWSFDIGPWPLVRCPWLPACGEG